jgi:hypothetical protein
MDNAAELSHSESEEVFIVDDDMTGGQGSKESSPC